ncbi:MAG: hypothetical protein H6659_18640 [Ardenticatenaceae bacterium]|nr:hypothetical protein [Ardenticatenaceae bacterium]
MARTTKNKTVVEEEQKTPPAEETTVADSPSPPVETEVESTEETAVAKETAVPPPEPKKATAKAPTVAPSELVWIKLIGAKTATVNHQAVLLNEVVRVRHSYYAQLRGELPGFFAVKLPGSKDFVVE